MNISIAYSPDTDDAFMVHALKERLIDWQGFTFTFMRADIQELNARACHSEFDITAISVAAYPALHKHYALMPVGASVGDQFGPSIVVHENSPIETIDDLTDTTIGVPGIQTTAFYAARELLPSFQAKPTYFLDIPDMVREGQTEAGILIHELQLEHTPHGLRKIADLGSLWHQRFALPLPLGANAIHRRLGPDLMKKLNALYLESIEYGLTHREKTLREASAHAAAGYSDQSMSNRYIDMYVNHDSVTLSKQVISAMEQLYKSGAEHGLCRALGRDDFIVANLFDRDHDERNLK